MQPTIPTVLGFDPLMQFVHIKDVIRAFMIAIEKNHSGIFNIVGKGALPISRILKLSGKINIPTPSPILSLTTDMLWYLYLAPAPAGHIDFLKYPFVADGTKAKEVLKFEPLYSSEEAILSLKRMQKEK